MIKLILIEVLFLFMIISCKNDYTASPLVFDKPVELKYGEIILNSDYKISIVLDSVINESRCPLDAECIWAGNAAVRFIYSSPEKKVQFVLNTISSFRTDSLIDGYRIKLNSLTPYPKLGIHIKQTDYKAEIEVKKIN